MHFGANRPVHPRTRLFAALAPILVAILLAGCGSSSSGDATGLVRQTFSGSHTVNSGNLSFAITISPSGSNTLTSPITISFGGPFQSLGNELTPDYHERTSVFSFKNAVQKVPELGLFFFGNFFSMAVWVGADRA